MRKQAVGRDLGMIVMSRMRIGSRLRLCQVVVVVHHESQSGTLYTQRAQGQREPAATDKGKASSSKVFLCGLVIGILCFDR